VPLHTIVKNGSALPAEAAVSLCRRVIDNDVLFPLKGHAAAGNRHKWSCGPPDTRAAVAGPVV
jgi:hypothetical protein